MALQAIRSVQAGPGREVGEEWGFAPESPLEGGSAPVTVDRRAELLRLRAELSRRQAEWREEEAEARCGTGLGPVDALLSGGFLKGQVSAISGLLGAGATTLAALAVARTLARGEGCAWVDTAGTLAAPALAALQVDLRRLLRVRPPPDQAVWAAQLLARSGALSLVVLDWPEERTATAAAQRLADAARAGGCVVLILAGEHDVPAAFKARLEAVLDRARPLQLVSSFAGPAEADANGLESEVFSRPEAAFSFSRPGRRVRLWVERSRRGGETSGLVTLTAPLARAPNPFWRGPGPLPPGVMAAEADYGALPVRPLVERLHTRPRSRYRAPPEGLPEQAGPPLPLGAMPTGGAR